LGVDTDGGRSLNLMANSSAAALWTDYSPAHDVNATHRTWAFGPGDDPAIATKLAMLVRDGPKRATTSLWDDYEKDNEPLPSPGEYSVVLDGTGTAACIIRTT
jgi:uncharacterized protein YhfF